MQGKRVSLLRRFHIYQGDYKDVVVNPNINKDIIFIDPLIYNNNNNVVIKDNKNNNIVLMGDITMEQLILNMLELFAFVVVKLPLNHADLFMDDDKHRHIFIMKYSKTQILIFKSDKNAEKYSDEEQIVLSERIKAEENGWYLLNDMTNGLVFGSIIKDDEGNETDRWSVKEHDGMYPNVPVREWKSSELVYDDGKPIQPSLMMKRLRQNFSKGNWKSELNLIKMKMDYTPTSPSKSYEIKRLPDEHIPSEEYDYIPTTPESSSNVSSYEKDYEIARTSPAAVAAAATTVMQNASANTLNNVNQTLQSVSKQLNDVQNKVSTYTQSAKNLATDIVANVSSNTENAAANASTVATQASQLVVNKASDLATNASQLANDAANKASNVGNTILDVVEGDKPISSILTAITEEAPKDTKTEEKKNDDVKRISI